MVVIQMEFLIWVKHDFDESYSVIIYIHKHRFAIGFTYDLKKKKPRIVRCVSSSKSNTSVFVKRETKLYFFIKYYYFIRLKENIQLSEHGDLSIWLVRFAEGWSIDTKFIWNIAWWSLREVFQRNFSHLPSSPGNSSADRFEVLRLDMNKQENQIIFIEIRTMMEWVYHLH